MTDVQTGSSSRSTTAPIVVGVDGSESSIGALRSALRIAEALGSGIVAIAAWQFPPMFGGFVAGDWSPENDAGEVLLHVTREVFGDDVPPWFRSEARQGPAAQVLLDASEGAEMLVVGSRGHGGFTGLLLGSVSSTCAEYAGCPVLVYHQKKEVLHREPQA